MMSENDEYEIDIESWISSAFQDIKPISGTKYDNRACVIKYSDDFALLMSYFRVIAEKKEYSDRALKLTEQMIACNPANYTAWCYRRLCLDKLGKKDNDELEYTTQRAIDTPKNYQIWYHRRVIVKELELIDEELVKMDELFELDAKNYHIWANRQWLLSVSNKFDGELKYVEELLEKDVRNNSAWNQRYFVVFKDWKSFADLEKRLVVEAELIYAFEKLQTVTLNQAVYAYILGICFLLGNGKFQAPEMLTFKIEKFIGDFKQTGKFCADLWYLLYQIRKEQKDIPGALSYLNELSVKDKSKARYWKKLATELDGL